LVSSNACAKLIAAQSTASGAIKPIELRRNLMTLSTLSIPTPLRGAVCGSILAHDRAAVDGL